MLPRRSGLNLWAVLLRRQEKIKADRPDLNVVVTPDGTMVDQMIDPNRVRVWVDIVAKVPKIG
ncbi:hypothetical protein PVAP13_7NG059600 [Panicum virgatum]|uniref:Uncharacterized protein n=1 Tax=Panicum virgatum TaxID=38727 RepID=A0A8T0PWM6_PANVG|nr:hypothetical protein PVAP13_7NG059600 [Panicum virgatum]